MPSDLIKKSRKTLRKHAKLSPPPQPPSPSSLPDIGDSISDLNPSPSSTLCMHCKLKLLRGPNSMICIYCGACQVVAGDSSLKPIGFHSTSGYRSLLKSLELNPEDRIGVFFDENRRNKSGTPVEEGISLAELLDVQIEWRDDPEKHETDSVEKTFDHISFLNISSFTTGSGRDSGSDISEEEEEEEEQSFSGENDPSDAYEDQENLSLFENDAPIETASVSSAESRHDAEDQSVTSEIHNDRNSLSGDDADIENENYGIQNEESEPVPQPFDLRDDSSSGHDADVTQNEDTKTGLSRGPSGDDMEVQSLNSKRQDEDSEAVDVSSDVRDDSSPGREADIQFVNSMGHENADSETNDAISPDLKKDSLSEDDTDINSVIKMAALSSDLRANSLSRRDSDVQSVNSSIHENEDINTNDAISSDLNRKSSSGRDLDLRDYSSSGGDPDVNLSSQENNDSISSDLKKNSSFDDDKEHQSVKANTENEDNKAVVLSTDLRGDSLSRRDAELQSVKAGTENEDFKSNSATSSDLRSDSLSRCDTDGEFVNSKTQENEDSNTNASISSDVRRDSLSGDDTEIETVNSRVQNDDSAITDLSTDLKIDSLPRRNGENDDFKANVAISSDLNKDYSSGDETQIQNVDSKISDVSRDEMEVYSVETRSQNEDSEMADMSSDLRIESSSRHDAEFDSVSSGTQENEDTKTAASPDTRKDNSFQHDTGTQSEDYRVQNDNSEATVAISSELDPDIQHVDSKTAAVSPNLSGNSSFDENAEIQPVNFTTKNEESGTDLLSVESSSQDDTTGQYFHSNIQNDDIETANASPSLRSESSFRDDTETQSVNSTNNNEDSKSDAHIDSVSENMEDANKDKTKNNLDPIDKD